MKAVYVIEQEAVPSAATDEQLKKIRYVAHKFNPKPVPVFPVGTEVEGPDALLFVMIGVCEPIDDECIKACGMSKAERAAVQKAYEMTHNGLSSPQDRDLALSGVILGYDENDKPIPGPKWDEYQAVLKKLQQEDEPI